MREELEKSLKRFLKRRITFTSAMLVAFMISGQVFAESIAISSGFENNSTWSNKQGAKAEEQGIAIGTKAKAIKGEKSNSGKKTKKLKEVGVAIGNEASAQRRGIAIGNKSVANFGDNKGQNIAIGGNAIAGTKDGSATLKTYIAGKWKDKTYTPKKGSTMDGSQVLGIGADVIALGDQSTAIGNNVVSIGGSSVSIGGDDLDLVLHDGNENP